jgi:hypothetical protein
MLWPWGGNVPKDTGVEFKQRLDTLIADVAKAGYAEDARALQAAADFPGTTSTEILGEILPALKKFRKTEAAEKTGLSKETDNLITCIERQFRKI